MSASGLDEYTVDRLKLDSERGALLSLWKEVFRYTSDQAEEKLSWMYENNPAGEGLQFCLHHTNEIVGVQSIARRQFVKGSQSFRAGIFADFVVTQSHRSLGPAVKLLKNVVLQSDGNIDFLYGFPNLKALPVFKRVGYRPLGMIGEYVCLLRSSDFIAKSFPIVPRWIVKCASAVIDKLLWLKRILLGVANLINYKFVEGFEFTEAYDRMWQESNKQDFLISVRNCETLNWRYFSEPGMNEWRIYTLLSRRNDKLLGYVVWSRSDDGVINVGDFYSLDPRKYTKALLSTFIVYANSIGAGKVVVSHLGSSNIAKSIVDAGFSKRGENPVYCVDLAKNMNVDEECYITNFDRDSW